MADCDFRRGLIPSAQASVEAVLEQLEAIAVTLQFNAFELLDRDADAKTLHGAGFGPGYASRSKRVTPTAQRCVVSRDNARPISTVRIFFPLNSWPSAVSKRMVVAM